MKQAEIKALCKQYIAGAVSDAHLLYNLQVGEDVKTMLWGVTELPQAAQLRIRIEDLIPEVESEGRPKEKTKAKTEGRPKAKSEQTYMQRLQYFIYIYWEDEDPDDMPTWQNPEITRSVDDHQTVRYSFAMRRAVGDAFAHQLTEKLRPINANELFKSMQSGPMMTVTITEAQLERINLIPPATEVTEIF